MSLLAALARSETGFKTLTTLGFGGTKVTDVGLKDLAFPYTGLAALTQLLLWETLVSDAGVAALMPRFLSIKVER